MHGERSELDELETFFRCRGARVAIEVCRWPTPVPGDAERAWLPDRPIRQRAGAEPHRSRNRHHPARPPATPNEGDLWAHSVGRGFFEQTELTTEEMDVGRWVFGMPARCATWPVRRRQAGRRSRAHRHPELGYVVRRRCRAPYRRQRLHQELIAARLNEALAQGCDVAAAATAPAGASQRNYERLGFQVVYTRVTLTK